MYHNVLYPVASIAEGAVKSSGVCTIKYFKTEDVLTWPVPDPLTGILSSSIALKPGKFIYLCEAVDPSQLFTETQKESVAGSFFDIAVAGTLKGSAAAHSLTLGTLKHHQWGLIITDKNGVIRLIGNQDTGADLSFDYTTAKSTDSRKTELIFKWQHPQPAPIYTATSFDITIGGTTITAGSIQLILRFEVGATGAPMTEGDTILINAGFINKYCLVLADGIALAVDDGSGAIDWSVLILRHLEKAIASNTIVFVGGVVNKEIIEVYVFS